MTKFHHLPFRSQYNTISIQHFTQLLQQLLSNTGLQRKDILIMGDFNEDLTEHQTNISTCLQQHGFQQLVQHPTTNQASLLDHIYFNSTSITRTEVCDTYYSDHDITLLAIATKNSWPQEYNQGKLLHLYHTFLVFTHKHASAKRGQGVGSLAVTRGRYASCGHAGGLSCYKDKLCICGYCANLVNCWLQNSFQFF